MKEIILFMKIFTWLSETGLYIFIFSWPFEVFAPLNSAPAFLLHWLSHSRSGSLTQEAAINWELLFAASTI